MFWRKFWEKRKTKEKEPDYDVESENLAIPEVHLHGHHGHKEEADVHHHGESISYDKDVYKRQIINGSMVNGSTTRIPMVPDVRLSLIHI